MHLMREGQFEARFVETADETMRAQELRWRAFRANGLSSGTPGRDEDEFDPICRHVTVVDRRSGSLVAAFRLLPLSDGQEIGRSYSAKHYELSALSAYRGRMVEIGRFCLHPEWHDPDILRVAWGAITRFVDANGVQMLFGCSSFIGTNPDPYRDAFAMLKDGHLAPDCWLPRRKAPKVFRFATRLRNLSPDRRRALKGLPPLLRTYLTMGGWVSDHAVVDHDLGTLHVFTGLEVANIPQSRIRVLRGLANSCL